MTEVQVPPAASNATPLAARVEDLVDEGTRDLIRERRSGHGHRRGWVVRRALVAADILGLTLAFAFSQIVADPPDATSATNKIGAWAEVFVFVATLPLWVVLARLFGLYSKDEEHADHTTVDDTSGVFVVVTIGSFLLLVMSWATAAANPYMPKLLVFWVSSIALVAICRAGGRAYARRSKAYLQNTVIVGAGNIAQLIASKIVRHREYGINLLGFVDKTPRSRRDDIGDLTILGDIVELPEIIDELDVERVIIAFAGQDQGRLLEDLRPLRSHDVQIDVVPRFFDLMGPGAEFHAIEGMPLIGLAPTHLPRSSVYLKRALDVIGSAVLLALLAPLMGYIIVRIKLDSRGPAMFRQTRPGLRGRPIEVLKFRTMTTHPGSPKGESAPLTDTDLVDEFAVSFKVRCDPRITRYGRVLRRRSLDELPQLINVLRGDMSLVGPRPMLPQEFAERKSTDAVDAILAVKPGITGYWQINGRSDADYSDRVRLEQQYVANWSLGLDFTILGKTARAVISQLGAR